MTAMAARIFRPYDPQYAEKCINAAKVSYEFLKNNPANVFATRVDSQQENMPLSVMQMTDCGRRLKCGRPWEMKNTLEILKTGGAILEKNRSRF